jgi:hypothetical protein
MPAQPLRIQPKPSGTPNDSEIRLDSECLLLETSGQTWYVPFDTLEWIPRLGESVQVAGAGQGKVTEVEYEFAPDTPPVRVGEKMSGDRSYVRPMRIKIKVS